MECVNASSNDSPESVLDLSLPTSDDSYAVPRKHRSSSQGSTARSLLVIAALTLALLIMGLLRGDGSSPHLVKHLTTANTFVVTSSPSGVA